MSSAVRQLRGQYEPITTEEEGQVTNNSQAMATPATAAENFKEKHLVDGMGGVLLTHCCKLRQR